MCVHALLIFHIESITDSQQHFVWKDVSFLFFIFMNVKMCFDAFLKQGKTRKEKKENVSLHPYEYKSY